MKKLKFASVLAVVLVALVCVVGCSAAPVSPSATVTKALNAVKGKDFDKLKECFVSSENSDSVIDSVKNSAPGLSTSYEDPDIQKIVNGLLDKLLSFDYELGSESVDGDHATVDVTIKTYDMGTAFTDAFKDYIGKGIGAALSGASQEEMTKMFAESIEQALNSQGAMNYSAKTQVNLTKVENDWKIDDVSEDNLDALFGGVMSNLKSFASNLQLDDAA
ncbi:MAG: hypothetical protein IJ125_00850 [Atopobiaceae bacterium]|nr:hypothetical protein [Atopobiaceae bacterium]